jgi:integrase
MRFTVLTAVRTSEALGSTWAEFDIEGRTWTVPASRMKTGHEHRVPLSDAAIALLKSIRANRQPRLTERVFNRKGRPLVDKI